MCLADHAGELCRWGGGVAVRELQIQLRNLVGNLRKLAENCSKLWEIVGKLRCRNQTSRSFNEQHFYTMHTQGTNKHARGTSKKQLQKNCGKWRKVAKLRKSAKIAGLNPAPPTPLTMLEMLWFRDSVTHCGL